MAKFSGGGNMQMSQMLKQAKKMQEQMAQMQAELQERTLEASAGGGAVTAVVSGKQELISVTIQPEVVDPDDIEMLQDLIVAAVNEALRQMQEQVADGMAKITGGINIPGLS